MEKKNNFCGKCGAPLSENAQFCPNCGNPISQKKLPFKDEGRTEGRQIPGNKDKIFPIKEDSNKINFKFILICTIVALGIITILSSIGSISGNDNVVEVSKALLGKEVMLDFIKKNNFEKLSDSYYVSKDGGTTVELDENGVPENVTINNGNITLFDIQCGDQFLFETVGKKLTSNGYMYYDSNEDSTTYISEFPNGHKEINMFINGESGEIYSIVYSVYIMEESEEAKEEGAEIIEKNFATNIQPSLNDQEADSMLETMEQTETSFSESDNITKQSHILIMNSDISGIIEAEIISDDEQGNMDGMYTQRSLPDWIKVKQLEESNSTGDLIYPSVIYLQNQEAIEATNQIILTFLNDEKKWSHDAENSTIDYRFILEDSTETESRYIGLALHGYRYFSDMPHGMGEDEYYTITPDEGILDISEIGGEQLKEAIIDSVRSTLEKRVVNEGLTLYDEPENITVRFNGDWILTSNGIHIIFGQDEIAPYFEGDIEVIVPYDEIDGYLNSYGKNLVGTN